MKLQVTSIKLEIEAFAVYTLNSFKQIADANVDKVTLEFGINVGGEAGIPYITKGSMGSNLKLPCSVRLNQQKINQQKRTDY